MIGSILAITRGAWTRIHGLLSSGYLNVKSVIDLVAGNPIYVDLLPGEAESLESWAIQSRAAVKDWFEGSLSVIPPQVPVNPAPMLGLAENTGNVTFQLGGVIKVPNSAPNLVTIDSAEIPSMQEMIERLTAYAYSGDATGTTAGYAKDLADLLMYHPHKAFIPLWLAQRVEQY